MINIQPNANPQSFKMRLKGLPPELEQMRVMYKAVLKPLKPDDEVSIENRNGKLFFVCREKSSPFHAGNLTVKRVREKGRRFAREKLGIDQVG